VTDFPPAQEHVRERGTRGPEFYNHCRAARHVRGDLDGALADFDRALVHQGDPECQADFRAAFLLDAPFTARAIVRLLDDGLRRQDHVDVLTNCRKHLRINPENVVARARRALTLLLGRDSEAYLDLRPIFMRSPTCKPFLQLLIDEAKQRRAMLFARILQSP
jgi:hypothetical protein